MKAQRIALTGASGTLGYHLVEKLITLPDTKVLALIRANSHIYQPHSEVLYHKVDFLDTTSLSAALQDFAPTCLIHCAASGVQLPKPEWFDLIRFNVDASLRLCEAISHFPGCRFIYVSTALAYRNQDRPLKENDPLDTLHPYGASKAAADLLIRAAAVEFHVPLVVTRPFSFTGIADVGTRLFPSLLRSAKHNTPLDLSPCDQIRDHSPAQDIADGILAASCLEPDASNLPQILNLGSGCTQPLRTVIESVMEELGLKVKLNFGARGYAGHEPMFLAADTSHANHILNWKVRHRLAYAVSQLARHSFPKLKIKKPQKYL